jgi:sugar phosphate isomerase/epimerase
MNWYVYDNKKPIWPQVDEFRPKLKDLVALSKEIGILPCYQNHSGAKNFGAGIWDMALLMRDYKPTELAWAFDIMHATVEGGLSWPTEVALVQDHIGMAFFKNFNWKNASAVPAPLGEGVVGKAYVNQLKSGGYRGPVCLHVEYLKGKLKDPGYLEEAIAATRRDLTILREWWS